MEARISRATASTFLWSVVTAFCFLVLPSSLAVAAGYRTANFTVDAPTPRLAKEIGDAAEQYRTQLAQDWLGKTLPNWSKPCPIKARVAPNLGAGGATSFVFDRGEVFDWRMEIQGSRERILDSVVPHEVTHTIFASHFRQPIPRWADEGACTTVEHRSEIAKQENMLIEFLQTRRGIPFSNMFAMKEYPQDVLPLYAQGHSLARFLIDQRGKREFLAFLEDGLANENWIGAVRERYGYRDLLTLQNTWQNWVVQGRPPLQLAADANTNAVLVASHEAPATQPFRSAATAVLRGQDPGAITPTLNQSPRSFVSSGSDGPIINRPHENTVSHAPWKAVGSTATPSSPPASVYDARATSRTLRKAIQR
ncbi:MAG: hypothetical protein GXP24_03910 [Planctomycetes bacterium]|nr:hypothetical protein [Planctomycetota bacterium]